MNRKLMHHHDFDLTIEELSKIEGAAGLEVKVKNNHVIDLKLKMADYKRFFTQAVRGKPAQAVPQYVARICGTCSNAHLLCALEAVENALHTPTSDQTKILRRLTINGLIIRDHALHLYVFALPDYLGVDSLLDLDENDEKQHQILHDTFDLKAAGNHLSIYVAGRSVHAPLPTLGGSLKIPANEAKEKIVQELEKARPIALRCIKLFATADFNFARETTFVALRADDYNFLNGQIVSSDGLQVEEKGFRPHFEHTVLPYSQASGYTYKGKSYLVGALARLNLSQDLLHQRTQNELKNILNRFPSSNIFDNNLAQAIEILHCLDDSIELLKQTTFQPEKPSKPNQDTGIGIGVIEAPRGTLYHYLDIKNHLVQSADFVVPTGQNQINIEQDLAKLIEEKIKQNQTKPAIQHACEMLIRAYDPCISCATHFLKIQWS